METSTQEAATQKKLEQVELAKKRCRDVIQRIEGLAAAESSTATATATAKITASCKRTLVKLALSELTFLSSRSASSFASNRFPLSFNIGHIEAVVHLLHQPFITGVSRVCKPIPLSTASSPPNEHNDNNNVHVDLVCTLHRNPVWIIVFDRNPKFITWNAFRPSKTSKGLKSRIEKVTAAARSAVALKPCSIILFFSKRHGLSTILCDKLKHEFGATEFPLDFVDFDFHLSEEEGDWTNVLVSTTSYTDACAFEIKVNGARRDTIFTSESHVKDSCLAETAETETETETHNHKDLSLSVPEQLTEFPHAFSSLISTMEFYSLDVKKELINFDTTALIALVSGISNGGAEKLLATPENELRQRFKGNYEFVIGQVMSEMQNPILVELGLAISRKRGLICESVLSEFKELVLMCGGPNEKLRASHLLNFLAIVADSPSERMMNLPTTRKLALKNKVVFGTGDYWCAPTVTANMAFVRAISQTGMSLFTIAHRPRALTGD